MDWRAYQAIHIPKRGTWMTNKQYSTLLVIREIQTEIM